MKREYTKLNPAKERELKNTSISLGTQSMKELPIELLDKVSGGDFVEVYGDLICPDCGSDNVYYLYDTDNGADAILCGNYSCNWCHLTWKDTLPDFLQ